MRIAREPPLVAVFLFTQRMEALVSRLRFGPSFPLRHFRIVVHPTPMGPELVAEFEAPDADVDPLGSPNRLEMGLFGSVERILGLSESITIRTRPARAPVMRFSSARTLNLVDAQFTDEVLLENIRLMIRELVLHEVDEALWFDERRLHDPHPERAPR